MVKNELSDASAIQLAVVTKSDTAEVNCRALYVGGAGDVAIMAKEDHQDRFSRSHAAA